MGVREGPVDALDPAGGGRSLRSRRARLSRAVRDKSTAARVDGHAQPVEYVAHHGLPGAKSLESAASPSNVSTEDE